MGGEQAAGVLATITQEQRKREGKEWTQEEEDAQFQEVEVFCLSTPTLSVSNSLQLVEAPPDYTVTAVVLLLAASTCLTLACTR